jgi:hypothetical protein
MKEATINLYINADPLLAVLSDLSAALSNLPPEVSDRLFDFNSIDDAALVECNSDSASAVDVIVNLYPSQRLRMLHAAFRAGNVDAIVVK